LYFGAEFTKFYAIKFGAGIIPSTFAVAVEQTEKVKKTGSDAEAHVGETIQVLK
jgi:membrane protein